MYVSQEDAARSARRGIWDSKFTTPWSCDEEVSRALVQAEHFAHPAKAVEGAQSVG